MEQHQIRVMEEKEQLDEKIMKLHLFIASARFSLVDEDEQTRMSAQLGAMSAYSFILGERLQSFIK